jgi:hypothetical protein
MARPAETGQFDRSAQEEDHRANIKRKRQVTKSSKASRGAQPDVELKVEEANEGVFIGFRSAYVFDTQGS